MDQKTPQEKRAQRIRTADNNSKSPKQAGNTEKPEDAYRRPKSSMGTSRKNGQGAYDSIAENQKNLDERKEYLEQIRAKRLNGHQPPRENKPAERPTRNAPERKQLERRPVERRPMEQQAESRVKRTVRTTGSNEMKVRAASKRRERRNRFLAVVAVILLILAIVGAIGGMMYVKKYGLSDEEMNASKYYDISREADLVLIQDSNIIGVGGIVEDEVPYLSYDTVTQYLNSRFYWDATSNTLLYTLEDGSVVVTLGSSEYSKGQEVTQTDYQILITEGTQVYIAAEFIQLYTNIDYTLYTDPYRIVVTSEWGDIETVTAKKDTQVRYQAGVKSDIISYVTSGDELIYLEEEEEIEDWTKVCTADGYIGYVQTKNIGEVETQTISREFEEQVYTNISVDYTINMAWHQVTSTTANDTLLTTIADTEGLTTIAPTWFFINSTDGEVTSLASSTYVNYANQLGLEVWAVLNDFDGEINSQEETLAVLSDSSAREKIINTIIAEAISTGIDGINVDIENVSTEAGEHYLQFIRELSVKCRQNGLVLSVDNYPPKSYNAHFDYEEQGIVADYVIIMCYDEHYSGSLEAGSVSSISYVEEAVTEMLTMVSADKIISAIPFYTRLWASTPKTDAQLAEQAGTEEAEYLYSVTSEAYGMTTAAALIEEQGVTPVWDEETQQYYAMWTVDDTTYEIWLEESESIKAKLEVMESNNLAGTAAWKLGFEDSSIWKVIELYVN